MPGPRFIEEIRLARLTAADLLSHLKAFPFEGRILWPADRFDLSTEVWVVSDGAPDALVAAATGFDLGPETEPLARAVWPLDTRDARRIAEAWMVAGGVATAENVLVAILHFHRHGEFSEPGAPGHVALFREVFPR